MMQENRRLHHGKKLCQGSWRRRSRHFLAKNRIATVLAKTNFSMIK